MRRCRRARDVFVDCRTQTQKHHQTPPTSAALRSQTPELRPQRLAQSSNGTSTLGLRSQICDLRYARKESVFGDACAMFFVDSGTSEQQKQKPDPQLCFWLHTERINIPRTEFLCPGNEVLLDFYEFHKTVLWKGCKMYLVQDKGSEHSTHIRWYLRNRCARKEQSSSAIWSV